MRLVILGAQPATVRVGVRLPEGIDPDRVEASLGEHADQVVLPAGEHWNLAFVPNWGNRCGAPCFA